MSAKHPMTSADGPQLAPSARTERKSALRNPLIWSLAATAILVLIAGLAFIAVQRATIQERTVTVSEAQAGSEVALQVGDTLQVSLESNPSTGYNWSVVELDAAVLRQVGEPEFHPASTLFGAPGMATYRFATVGTGQTSLTLTYARPFDKAIPPLKTVTFNVRVTGA